jgi:histidinol-phosphate phosphatase family protein
MIEIDIVIPTIGRPSLRTLLASLAASAGPPPRRIIIVDDRKRAGAPLDLGTIDSHLHDRMSVLRGPARGPAAARNVGWRAAQTDWVAFLDDDVIAGPTWLADLAADVRACPRDAAASQGRVTVPLPADRKPTDWERNVAGLAGARWITADCAYRRGVLCGANGFDERFPRAFREDADLALRVVARGWQIVWGTRGVSHPVRPESPLVSIAQQAGNADDVLMAALHGDDWFDRAGATRGAFRSHVWTVGFALASLLCGAAWLSATAAFAWRRIAPGPRTPAEIRAMLVTSVALPFAAVAHRIAGHLTLHAKLRAGRTAVVEAAPRAAGPDRRPLAVLFDRDGTLVEDVPYNGEPAAVRTVTGAGAALARLRAAGLALGIVSNQSGIALGKITPEQVAAVHERIVELLGPFDTIQFCPHAPDDGCDCRKPAPGLIDRAARALGLTAGDCVVIGDIGADIEAARAAGARSVLVPTPLTRPAEIAAADRVAGSLTEAVDFVLGAPA